MLNGQDARVDKSHGGDTTAMDISETLTDPHAAWNAGRHEIWDPHVAYSPGDAVTAINGLSGWIATVPSRGVRPCPENGAWVMVWGSGPGPVGAPGPQSRT